MKEKALIKIMGVCLIISVSCNIIGACVVIERMNQFEKEPPDDFNDIDSAQNMPIPLNVNFEEDTFYFIDNTEISSGFEIIFDYFSSGHEFHFYLNPDFDFLNISANIETVEKYFLNIHIKSWAFFPLFKNDEYNINSYSIYPEGCPDGAVLCNRLLLETRDIDDFFVDETFKIYWHASKESNYVERKTFTFRILNLEKIRLLTWNISDKYTVSTNKNELIEKWDDITTEYTNGWFYLPAILKHDTDPWKDYPVELWYNPNTYETVIKEVKI